MNLIYIYLISYLVTYLGYLLGKEEVVKQELKELQKAIKFASDSLIFITYLTLLYLFPTNGLVVFVTVCLIIMKIVSMKGIYWLKQVHNILLFSATLMFAFKFANSTTQYFAIYPIMILFIENTNQAFDKFVEIYKTVLLIISFILLNVL